MTCLDAADSAAFLADPLLILCALAADAAIAPFLEVPFCITIAALLTFGLDLARAVLLWETCLVELLRDVVRGLRIPEIKVSGAPSPWLDMQGPPDRGIRDWLQDLRKLRRGHARLLRQARYHDQLASRMDVPLLGIEAIAGRSSSTHFARFEVRLLGENQLLHELRLALQVDAALQVDVLCFFNLGLRSRKEREKKETLRERGRCQKKHDPLGREVVEE